MLMIVLKFPTLTKSVFYTILSCAKYIFVHASKYTALFYKPSDLNRTEK